MLDVDKLEQRSYALRRTIGGSMKRTKLFSILCLVAVSQLGFQVAKAEEKDFWVGSGVDRKFVNQFFFSNENCMSAPQSFVACVEAINDSLSELGTLYRVVPDGSVKPFDGEFVKTHAPRFASIKRALAPLKVVEWKLPKIKRTPKQAKEWIARLNRFWMTTYVMAYQNLNSDSARAAQAKKIDFTRAVVLVAKQIVKHDGTLSLESVYADSINRFLAIAESPHTSIEPDESFENDLKTADVKFSGVGMNLKLVQDKIFLNPLIGGPSEIAGVKANDRLLGVDGVDVSKIDFSQVLSKMRGKDGSTVTIDIERDGGFEMIIPIKRGQVVTNNVSSSSVSLLGKRYGYVSVNTFEQRGLAEKVRLEVRKLIADGAHGLILDVRDNLGGLLDESTKLAGLFLAPGALIATKEIIKGMPGKDEKFESKDGEFSDLPLIVLINGHSASASEVLTLALQENERAWIVGDQSYGKGVGMTALPVTGKPKLLFWTTNFKFFGPAHQSNHLSGIEPDFKSDRRPDLSEDEKFVSREADGYYYVSESEKRQFMHSTARRAEKSTIDSCLGSSSFTELMAKDLAVQGRVFEVDMQLIKAQEILDCQAKN